MVAFNSISFSITISLLMGATIATAERSPRPVTSLLEMRQSNVVLQRWDLSCGAAAVATVLTYDYDDPVAEREVVETMLRNGDPLRVKARGGFSMLDLQQYMQGSGYPSTGYGNLRIQDLVKLAPAIVPVRLDGYDHFVVFRKVSGGRVLLADPAFGNRSMSYRDFKQAWHERLALSVRAPVAAR